VNDGDRVEGCAEHFNRRFNRSEFDLRKASELVVGFEDVAKHIAQKVAVTRSGIERHLAGLVMIGERPQVVDAKDVVSVRVRVKDGIELRDVLAQSLFAEIGCCVDQHMTAAVADHDGGTRSAVARIAGVTNGAIAPNGGNSHGGAAAENRQCCLHL